MYMIGFACIEGMLGVFIMVMGGFCTLKMKRKYWDKCCKKKEKQGPNKKGKQEGQEQNSTIEMEERTKKGGAKYNEFL